MRACSDFGRKMNVHRDSGINTIKTCGRHRGTPKRYKQLQVESPQGSSAERWPLKFQPLGDPCYGFFRGIQTKVVIYRAISTNRKHTASIVNRECGPGDSDPEQSWCATRTRRHHWPYAASPEVVI
jgi:hypothetical protein